MKYHINPNTGVPSVCYANKGNCPYAAESKHYSTYEEAEMVSDKLLEYKFPIFEQPQYDDPYDFDTYNATQQYADLINKFPDSSIVDEINNVLDIEDKYEFLNDMQDGDVVEYIKETDDEEFLSAVLNRQILVESDNDDNKYIEAIIENPNFPNDIKQDMIYNIEEYETSFILSVLKHQEFDEDSLFNMASNSSSEQVKKTIMSSKNIPVSTITLNVGEDGLADCNPLALYFYYNQNTPKSIKINLYRRMLEYEAENGVRR